MRQLCQCTAAKIREYIKTENEIFEGVTAEPIQLTLSGCDLPTLTLVDLPGGPFRNLQSPGWHGCNARLVMLMAPAGHPYSLLALLLTSCICTDHVLLRQWQSTCSMDLQVNCLS